MIESEKVPERKFRNLVAAGVSRTIPIFLQSEGEEYGNAACVYASKATHMTRTLRHIDLTDSWIKEKVADGTCVLVKVDMTKVTGHVCSVRGIYASSIILLYTGGTLDPAHGIEDVG